MRAMNMASLEQLQLVGRFETLRRLLLAEQYFRHQQRPLAYWVLPSDRRLPQAFLGRTVRELLQTPYEELAATPGIGRKKMRSLVKLLERAVRTDAADLPDDLTPSPQEGQGLAGDPPRGNGFDASAVSELVWDQWRASVVRHGLGKELLGRLAPSLKDLSRVIWNTPLEHYADKTLAEMRAMKTHGEKRVGAILEVFHGVHAVIAHLSPEDHLVVRVAPRRIDAVETWVLATLQRPGVPDREEIHNRFLRPLMEQIRCDASHQVVQLAENRVGMHGPVASASQAARGWGLTRARIYQLLGEINAILSVRWPLGRPLVHELRDKFLEECQGGNGGPHSADLELFLAAVELFFPPVRRRTGGRAECQGSQRPSAAPRRDFPHADSAAKSSHQAFTCATLPR